MLHGLDLFSGIGGITKALEPWVRPVAYCESDRYAQAVLLSRMRSGDLPSAPICTDVRLLHEGWPGDDSAADPGVDIIYGGFPCQDISVAGAGLGLAGARSGLVFEIFRLADRLGPSYIFLENVPAIRTRGAERVVKELASRGYDCRWDCLSAADVGAPHVRNRWFLLAAHADRLKLRQFQQREPGRRADAIPNEGEALARLDGAARSLAHSDGARQPQRTEARDRARLRVVHGGQDASDSDGFGGRARGTGPEIWQRFENAFRRGWWSIEPDVGRVAHGIPFRVDRIRGLGNAVVPAQAREAFKRLSGLN